MAARWEDGREHDGIGASAVGGGHFARRMNGGDAEQVAMRSAHLGRLAINAVRAPAAGLSHRGGKDHDMPGPVSNMAQCAEAPAPFALSKVIMPKDETALARQAGQQAFKASIIARIGKQPEAGKGLVSWHQSSIARP